MLADTTTTEASAIAEEAFVLAYPLVLSSRVMARATAVAAPDPATMRAPVNTLVHGRDTPDTLRSSGWLDLGPEPVVLSVPDTRGRFYALWLRDGFNRVFACIGARTTGTAPGAFAVFGPSHQRTGLPPGMSALMSATRMVRVTGCIESVNEPDDEALSRAHGGFALVPLSRWGRDCPAPPVGPGADDPVGEIDRMEADAFFAEVARLVGARPPVLARLHDLPPAAVRAGVDRARAAIRAAATPPRGVAGRWRITTPNGADPLARAAAARAGQVIDPPADVLHAYADADADGLPLSGQSRYRLCFAPDAPPPVHGFWSLTTTGGAHATGDRRGLVLDRDGTLPIHLQHNPPARRHRSNWLPAPAGAFGVELRLCWPREEALDGAWSPPPITRADRP